LNRRPLLALVAASGVVAFLMVADQVGFLIYLVQGQVMYQGWSELGNHVVFGIGMFLVLWLLLPITGNWTIARAIGAGALASVGGAVVVAVGNLLMALAFAREASGSLYDLVPLDLDPIHLVATAVSMAVWFAPLTVLAAVLVREWLRSRAAVDAPKEPVSTV
jgi:hypothetical protein